MNIYRHRFICTCPENAQPVTYDLQIQSLQMIRVEQIVSICAAYQQSFHETMADDLLTQFPGFHILIAHHHGVDIETHRGTRPQYFVADDGAFGVWQVKA